MFFLLKLYFKAKYTIYSPTKEELILDLQRLQDVFYGIKGSVWGSWCFLWNECAIIAYADYDHIIERTGKSGQIKIINDCINSFKKTNK